MQLKRLTPEIRKFLATIMPLEIPTDLAFKAQNLNIKEIYSLQGLNLADYYVYGNHIVIVEDGQFIDIDICPNRAVESIIALLS